MSLFTSAATKFKFTDGLDLANDALHFATGLATVAGLIYSGMLFAIFAPVVAAQRDYGRDLLRAIGPPIQTDEADTAEDEKAHEKKGDAKKADPEKAARIREEKFKEGRRKEAKEGGMIDSPAAKVIKSVLTALAPSAGGISHQTHRRPDGYGPSGTG